MAPNLTQIDQGQFQPSLSMLSLAVKSNDYELYAAELGRVQQLSLNYNASTNTFMPLMTKVERDELQAKIRGSYLLVNTASLLTNDNVIPYQLASYEVVFLYQYQALNFIATGDISNALVAARKANELQIYLAQDYQKQLYAAQQAAQKNQLNLNFINNQNAQLQNTLQAAASVKDSFANAMSYYLSALLFLATHDLNNASVALRQAVSIMPNNTYLQNLLLITLQNQGAPASVIHNYQQAFGIKRLPQVPQNKAWVAIMYEQNFVNARIPISIPVSVPGFNQAQLFSFPAYAQTPTNFTPLVVSANANNQARSLGATELMVNTNALAAKDLLQQYPIIFVREALRFLTKMSMVYAAQNKDKNNNSDNFAAALMQIYTIVSDRPDLRSWLTLPQNIQIAQYALTPGTYTFHLNNGSLDADVTQTLQAGRYYLIWVTQYGAQIKAVGFQL
jgi:hypothetical protein